MNLWTKIKLNIKVTDRERGEKKLGPGAQDKKMIGKQLSMRTGKWNYSQQNTISTMHLLLDKKMTMKMKIKTTDYLIKLRFKHMK